MPRLEHRSGRVVDAARAVRVGCRCVTSEPATIITPPIACSNVHGSRRITTASTSVTTTWSWTTGAVRLTPAAWLAL
jgi:hypothetical protein